MSFVWQNEPLGFGHAVLQAREEVFSFRKWNPPVLIATDDGVRNPADADKPSFDLIREMTASLDFDAGCEVGWECASAWYGDR